MSALKKLMDEQRAKKAACELTREQSSEVHGPGPKFPRTEPKRPSDSVLDELFDVDGDSPAPPALFPPASHPINGYNVQGQCDPPDTAGVELSGTNGRKQSSSPVSVAESPVPQEVATMHDGSPTRNLSKVDGIPSRRRNGSEKRPRSPSPPVQVIDVISPQLPPATTLQQRSKPYRQFRPPRRKSTPVASSSAPAPVIHVDDDDDEAADVPLRPSLDLDEAFAREMQAQEFGMDFSFPMDAQSRQREHSGHRGRPVAFNFQSAARGYRVGGYASVAPPLPRQYHDHEYPHQRNVADVLMRGEFERGRRNRRWRDSWDEYLDPNRAGAVPFSGGVGGVPAVGLDLMTRELTAEDYERLLALDDGHKKHKSASVTDLSLLPTHVATEAELSTGSQEDNTCCVCLSSIDAGDVVKRLPCLHAFHADCIDGWLKVNATCPIDKTNVFE